MSNFDHIRIEGDGINAHGRQIRVYRNGDLIPGVTHVKFEADVKGVQELVLTQIVILEEAVGIEEATQALEEREAAWNQMAEASGHYGRTTLYETEHRPGDPESLIPNALRPMLEADERS